MSTATQPLTHCPNCNAKLKRPDLSLCAYCATPLQLGGKVGAATDETTQRLKRLRDKPEFAPLMSVTPPDHEVEGQARRRRRFALALLAIGVAFSASAALTGQKLWSPWHGGGAVLYLLGVANLFRAAQIRSQARRLAMLRRPAIVVERRSETALSKERTPTIYYFTLRFDDGSEGEFRWRGQGTLYEPLTNGMTGVAFTRGQQLVEFKRL